MNSVESKRIFLKVKRGLSLINFLQEGKDLNIKEKNEKMISDMILDLIHLRQYAFMHNLIGTKTNDDEMKTEAKRLIEIVSCRQNDDAPTAFETIMNDLLTIKCSGDISKHEKIHQICCNIVSKEWINAGLLNNTEKSSEHISLIPTKSDSSLSFESKSSDSYEHNERTDSSNTHSSTASTIIS